MILQSEVLSFNQLKSHVKCTSIPEAVYLSVVRYFSYLHSWTPSYLVQAQVEVEGRILIQSLQPAYGEVLQVLKCYRYPRCFTVIYFFIQRYLRVTFQNGFKKKLQ